MWFPSQKEVGDFVSKKERVVTLVIKKLVVMYVVKNKSKVWLRSQKEGGYFLKK